MSEIRQINLRIPADMDEYLRRKAAEDMGIRSGALALLLDKIFREYREKHPLAGEKK